MHISSKKKLQTTCIFVQNKNHDKAELSTERGKYKVNKSGLTSSHPSSWWNFDQLKTSEMRFYLWRSSSQRTSSGTWGKSRKQIVHFQALLSTDSLTMENKLWAFIWFTFLDFYQRYTRILRKNNDIFLDDYLL